MSTAARDVRGARALPRTAGALSTRHTSGHASVHAGGARKPAHTKSFAVFRGSVPRAREWPPKGNTRDALRRCFDGELQTAVIAMCAQMRRQPTRTFYEIRRDKTRNYRPWGPLLRVIDTAIVAGAPIDRVEVLAELVHDYVIARGKERPDTAEEAAIAAYAARRRHA
jgi:hypothetical protein